MTDTIENSDKGKAPKTSIGSIQPTNQERGRQFDTDELVLDRYRVLSELGRGGMGVVYRCHDTVTGTDIALKALPPEVSRDAEEMAAIQENFQLVEELHHPNIAAVKTLEPDDATGDYYLIMQCVEGRNLSAYRRNKGGVLPPAEALTIAMQIATALDYAHSRRVIHRDIKPSNVMITFESDKAAEEDITTPARAIVKILDFGLAAQIHSSLSRVTKADYGTSGTAPYMAPEQWLGEYQDAATDQYALAALIYELISGRPPFVGHDMRVLGIAVLNGKAKPPKGIGRGLWKVLRKGLSKQRKGRYPSCSEFVQELIRNCPALNVTGTGKALWMKMAVRAAACILLLSAAGFAGWRYGYRPWAEERARASEPTVERAATPEPQPGSPEPAPKPAPVPQPEPELPEPVPEPEPKPPTPVSDPIPVPPPTPEPELTLAPPPNPKPKPVSTPTPPVIQPTPKPVTPAAQPALALQLEVGGGRRRFREGNKVTCTVQVNKDCYLALLCHQSDGSTVILYPNLHCPTTRVAAGSTVKIPSKVAPAFEIEAGPPFGRDTVEAIGCTAKSALHRMLEQETRTSTTAYRGIDRGMFVKQVEESMDDTSAAGEVQWDRTSVDVLTERR